MSKFKSQELADLIIEEISNGKPLRQICRDQKVSKSSIYNWLNEDEEFFGRFTRARIIGAHDIADECLEIADDTTDEPASRRVRVETRLKLLARWFPQEYGEKRQIDHTSSDGSMATKGKTLDDFYAENGEQ